jgi:signal transduction histidine kinase
VHAPSEYAGTDSRGVIGTDDLRLLRLAGIALPVAVWALGIFSPPRDGLSAEFVATFTALTGLVAAIEFWAPGRSAPVWQRLIALVAELVLAYLIVRAHGTLIRPALIYIVPASRALLLFDERVGVSLSLLIWIGYGLNLLSYGWPDRMHELPGYIAFVLPLYLLTVVLTLAVIRQMASRVRLQQLYDDLARAHQQLQKLGEQARLAAVAEERNRLAREIHDSLAHYLTVINVQLEAAEKLAGTNHERALVAVRHARRLVIDCLQDVRHSVGALRASSLEELRIDGALRKLASDFSTATAVQVEVAVPSSTNESIAPEIRQALFRVAQEGLTNVQKHARATHVWLTLESSAESVRLTVRDNGRGNDDKPRALSGFGLVGLRERVELHGGHLSFERITDGGSMLTAEIPVATSNTIAESSIVVNGR